VIGPDGTVLPATIVSTNLGNGPQVQATYQITFAGEYDGQYTVTAAISGTEAVRDANGNALTSSTAGTFNILPPTTIPYTTVAAVASSLNAISVQPPAVSLINDWTGDTSNILRHGKIDFAFRVTGFEGDNFTSNTVTRTNNQSLRFVAHSPN